MLQWMGGSRRKVTTSRRSTQKRQKQYFEQRKRQHQEQEQNISELESYSLKRVPSTQCNENNRSLDVLSLRNLSKNGQDCTSRLSEGKGRPNGEHTTPNDQTVQCPNASQMDTKNLRPSEHGEIRETRIASNHLEETVCCQDHHGASERNDAIDLLKTTTEYKSSVVDMLGDDGENSSSRGNLVLENHVAFSVEGLGKVEIETPAHSPQHPTRNFSNGCPEPFKISKGFHSSKNLNSSLEEKLSVLDDIAFDVDLPTDVSRLELPYLKELCHNSKQKTTVCKERLLQNAKYFSSDDDFYDRRVKQDGFKWHDESSFLDDIYVDDNCGISRNSWSCDLDSRISRSRNYDKPEFSFEGLHMQNRRASVKAASSFNKQAGLSSPYKQQMEHGCDFIVSDRTGYPITCNNCEFSEMTHCSAWPSLQREDTRDRLSFLREDSCLSSAVWHDGAMNTSFKSTERQKTRGPEAVSRRPVVNKFSTKKSTFDQELWQRESGVFSGTCNRMSDFSTPGDVWLFGEQCDSENGKPGYASMNASETKKDSPFDYKHWTEEPFYPYFYPKVYVDDKQSASRSDHDAFSGNLFSEKVAFCQQVSPIHSSHVIKSTDVECGHQELFTGLFKKEEDFRRMKFQESVSTGDNRSVTLPAISSTLNQSNYSSSTKETPMNVLDSEDNHSQFEESKVKTPLITPGPNAALSPLRSDGGSSSVEMPQNLEEYVELKHANGTETSALSQNEYKETEDCGHGKGDLKHEGPHSNLGRCRKVMMFGRFFLQLL